MATVYKAPADWAVEEGGTPRHIVFLAGSTEMGVAEKWQDRVCRELADENVVILNPRRDDWDASWVTRADNPQFRQQVEWELTGLEWADTIAMYFDPATKSPTSLLELGLHIACCGMIVCCPEGFWRKGNVDIVCQRYNVEQVDTLEELVHRVVERAVEGT